MESGERVLISKRRRLLIGFSAAAAAAGGGFIVGWGLVVGKCRSGRFMWGRRSGSVAWAVGLFGIFGAVPLDVWIWVWVWVCGRTWRRVYDGVVLGRGGWEVGRVLGL